MAEKEKLMKKPVQEPMGGRAGGTLGSNLELGGFVSPVGFTFPSPQSRSMFGASAQQSSQDFSRLSMPQTPSIPLGNTIPAFTDNYNQVMGDRMRAPSSMVSGIRDGDVSGFSLYSPTVPSMGGLTQAPSMDPTTDTISSFGNPLASRTIRVSGPAGYGSTTLTPEQQTARFRASQQAEQMGAAATASSRTPAQQQALLAQMRISGAETMRENLEKQEKIIAQRRANPELYTTRSGAKIAAPTNMFGQPIASWQKAYETAGRTNEAALARMGRGVQPATSAQSAPASPSFGVRGIGGVTMPFGAASLSGGPQIRQATQLPMAPISASGQLMSRPSQYSNKRAEQRKQIRELAQYRREFSGMGLI